jgi:hypothetical protein
MQHIRELITRAKAAYPDDNFFEGVEQSLKLVPLAHEQYGAYERALSSLDPDSWSVLRDKAIKHFLDHRNGQLKQGFFNQLNDAFAYEYLVSRRYGHVRILEENGKTQPDIEYMNGEEKRFCEVKTIGISDELIERRAKIQATSSSIYRELPSEFLLKLKSTLDAADDQIKARGMNGLIYLLIYFDDFTLDHYDCYRKQISDCLESHKAENIYIKIGLLGRKRICKTRDKVL